jgi:hypothetical protein
LLDKITYAGANKSSFREGSKDLRKLSELTVPEKQVERLSERIGHERVAERNAQLAAFERLPLKERCDGAPAGVAAPPVGRVAVVMADAGMLQLREPQADDDETPILAFPSTGVAPEETPVLPMSPAVVAIDQDDVPILAFPPAADAAQANDAATDDAHAVVEAAPGVSAAEEADDAKPSGKHWHENKVGLAMTMSSATHASDPCPQIPATFVDPQKIVKLVRQLKNKAAVGEDGLEAGAPEVVEEVLQQVTEYEAPQLETRTVVASRRSWPLFGPLLALAAWQSGFAKAERKAFVADGAGAIRTVWRRFFSSYVPILDFIHALSYVFAAAVAVGGDLVRGWPLYVQWITWVWQGQVPRLIELLAAWQDEHGKPEESDGTNHPRAVVERVRVYLCNHEPMMKYDAYRCQGLPLTSSLMESMVKQVNRRVKGTEKFWTEDGAEAILQLRADYLSDGDVMEDFWERRQAEATGQRQYRKAG